MTLKLASHDFANKGPMPRYLTAEGNEISPELHWSGVPDGTRSLALIVDDPDAPDPDKSERIFAHWVLFNIPPDTCRLAPGAGDGQLPKGTRVGVNDFRRARYGGPSPPIGRHRYFHKLYALDTVLDLNEPTKAELEQAMKGHVLAKDELVGTYQKGQD